MKKAMSFLLVLAILFHFAGCTEDAPTGPNPELSTQIGGKETEGTMPSGAIPPETQGTTPSGTMPPETQGTTPSGTMPPETQGTTPSGTMPTEPDHVHDYEILNIFPPTCTESGYTIFYCSCGDEYQGEETEPTGHQWSEWFTFTDPTETTEGSAQRTCQSCYTRETKVLPPLNHEHDYHYDVKLIRPTCTEIGYNIFTCRCGDSYRANERPALGHSYLDTITKPATCTEEGVRTWTCCNDGCGDSYTVPIEIIEHQYDMEIIEVSCTQDGYYIYTCTGCGDTYSELYCQAYNHYWSAWEITQLGDCVTATIWQRVCPFCAEVQEKTENRGWHNFSEQGICSGCGTTCSLGLEFLIFEGEGEVYVTGMGSCTDTTVVIPDLWQGLPVTMLLNGAFANCTEMTSVVIPNTVHTLDINCFYGSGLVTVTIPASVTAIEDTPFNNCKNLTAIHVDPANPSYCSADGVLFDKAMTTLLLYPQGKPDGKYTVPNGVTAIRSLTGQFSTLVLPDGLQVIGAYALSSCNNLTQLTLPDSVTEVGEGAISFCDSLEVLELPSGLTVLPEELCRSCHKLWWIKLDSTLTKISATAFYTCPVTKVSFQGTMEQWHAVEKPENWTEAESYHVFCQDGDFQAGEAQP